MHLSQIHFSDKSIEWEGYHTQQNWLEGISSVQNSKTRVVFGPVIYSPPTHPDTVLTALVHLEKCLTTFRFQFQRHKRSYPTTWTVEENSHLGDCGRLSHQAYNAGMQNKKVTSFSTNTVWIKCCHILVQPVTTPDSWKTLPKMPKQTWWL